jgi:Putative peptidoglycan binding domain/Caspase domain
MSSQVKVNLDFLPAGRNLTPSGLAVILIAIFMQLVFSFGAQAGGRIALVLACEKYDNFEESQIDVKWAGELGEALKEHNFDVTVAADRNDAESRAALRDFALKASEADFALIVVGGHVVTYQSQSFFLPQNAKIQRATDVFSRALSLASIADIAGKAKSAALLVLMTVPDIAATVSDIDTRPAMGGRQAANVITVFSSSPRVPVSGIDRVAEQASEKLLAAAQEDPLRLAALVNSVSAEGVGLIVGKVSDIDLSAPSSSPKLGGESKTAALQGAEAAAKAQVEVERRPREASIAPDQGEDTLTSDERGDVQRRLQSLRLYQGLADGMFGEQTRVAIREFQKLSGMPETGFLTRAEFGRLVNAH